MLSAFLNSSELPFPSKNCSFKSPKAGIFSARLSKVCRIPFWASLYPFESFSSLEKASIRESRLAEFAMLPIAIAASSKAS